MNFSEILTFVRQRIKKLPESPFLHTYIYSYEEHESTMAENRPQMSHDLY
jgi:hypothetical protein